MNGVNKYRFGNMVHYDLADLEANREMISHPYCHSSGVAVKHVLEHAIATENFRKAIRALGRMAKS